LSDSGISSRTELVTIHHHLREFLFRFPLMGGNRKRVNSERGCGWGMSRLHLCAALFGVCDAASLAVDESFVGL
jgi:hypothetical protein